MHLTGSITYCALASSGAARRLPRYGCSGSIRRAAFEPLSAGHPRTEGISIVGMALTPILTMNLNYKSELHILQAGLMAQVSTGGSREPLDFCSPLKEFTWLSLQPLAQPLTTEL